MKNLLIVGAGGFGREVLGWALDHPDCGRKWEVGGFLDNNPNALSSFSYEQEVLGSVDDYQPNPNDLLVCAIGSPKPKETVCKSLLERGGKFISLIHPTVIIGANVSLGEGVVICPRCVLTCDIELGDFVMLNLLTTCGHDVRIGAYSTLSSHCDLTGGVKLGKGVFTGSGVRVVPSKTVGDGAILGAGSVVTRNVKAGVTVFGSPAKEI